MDRVKESLFNVISSLLPAKKALDLFAGCGSLGFEALSRGVEQVVFVDSHREATRVIEKNIEKLALPKTRARILKLPWNYAIRELEKEGVVFDLVFLDPPYSAAETPQNVLLALGDSAIVRPNSHVILEHSSKCHLQGVELEKKFLKWKELDFGGTHLSFFEIKP